MAALWPITTWCFRMFFSGVWPARKQKPCDRCVGNAKGNLWQGVPSLPSLSSVIIWPTSRGNRSTSLITDLRATTGSRTSLVDLADWYLSEKHDLFNDPRVGLIVFHAQLDILHLVDLGVCQHFGGNPVLV